VILQHRRFGLQLSHRDKESLELVLVRERLKQLTGNHRPEIHTCPNAVETHVENL